MRAVISFALALVASLVVLLAGAAADGGTTTRRFSAAEQRSLARGDLVTRAITKRRGGLSLMGGSSWQTIALEPDALFNALLDTPSYPRMFPRVVEARVVATSGNRRTVFIRQQASLVTTRFYVTVRVYRERRDITFTIDPTRPHSIRAAWGFMTVRPAAHGRSTLSYGVMADIGDGLVAGVLRPTVHRWLLRVPSTVKQWVEGRGRARYVRAR